MSYSPVFNSPVLSSWFIQILNRILVFIECSPHSKCRSEFPVLSDTLLFPYKNYLNAAFNLFFIKCLKIKLKHDIHKEFYWFFMCDEIIIVKLAYFQYFLCSCLHVRYYYFDISDPYPIFAVYYVLRYIMFCSACFTTAAPYVDCSSASYKLSLAIAVLIVMFFTLGFPLLLLATLYKMRFLWMTVSEDSEPPIETRDAILLTNPQAMLSLDLETSPAIVNDLESNHVSNFSKIRNDHSRQVYCTIIWLRLFIYIT